MPGLYKYTIIPFFPPMALPGPSPFTPVNGKLKLNIVAFTVPENYMYYEVTPFFAFPCTTSNLTTLKRICVTHKEMTQYFLTGGSI